MILILADNRDLLYTNGNSGIIRRGLRSRSRCTRAALALPPKPTALRAGNDAALQQDDRALAAWKKGEVAPPPLVRLVALDRDAASDRAALTAGEVSPSAPSWDPGGSTRSTLVLERRLQLVPADTPPIHAGEGSACRSASFVARCRVRPLSSPMCNACVYACESAIARRRRRSRSPAPSSADRVGTGSRDCSPCSRAVCEVRAC